MSKLNDLSHILGRRYPGNSDEVIEMTVKEFNFSRAEDALIVFNEALRVVLGAELGLAVFATLAGRADRPNTKLAPNLHRAHVGKWSNRCRRGLGWEPEFARKGIGRGRKPKTPAPATPSPGT